MSGFGFIFRGLLGRGGRGLGRGMDFGSGNDEEVIGQAVEGMYGLTGNAGQDAILDQGMPTFEEWAKRALEEPGAADEWPAVIQEALAEGSPGKYEGTELIWDEGFRTVAEQSKFHDSVDEQGEGTGSVF